MATLLIRAVDVVLGTYNQISARNTTQISVQPGAGLCEGGQGLGTHPQYATRELDHRERSSPSLAACKSASMAVDALIPV